MNAMRGGAKTGWTAGLCPEPHGIRTFWNLWYLLLHDHDEDTGPMGAFSVLPRGELDDVRTSVR